MKTVTSHQSHVLRLALLCALAAFATAAQAKPINDKRPANADARVSVDNVRGEIRVSGWDRGEVEITGNLGEGSKLEIDGSGASVDVRVVSESGAMSWWGGNGPRSDTQLVLHVPRAAALDLQAVSASIAVDGIRGSREVEAESVSGDVEIDAEATRWDLSSVSGDIVARGRSENAQVETVSGDLTAEGVNGELSAETVSGSATLVAGRVTRLSASSVSGDLRLELTPASGSRTDVESMSGDVTVLLPGDVSARIEAESFSGTIRSDFGTVEEEEHGPGSSLRATAGGGSATINAETFSGDLEVRRR